MPQDVYKYKTSIQIFNLYNVNESNSIEQKSVIN